MIFRLFLILLCTPWVCANPDYSNVGEQINARMEKGVAITEGVIRVRRRHENDMDFSKYNPFYWEGRLTRFKVEDHTPNGENKMVFTLFTEWPQDDTKYRGNDFSAIYTGDPLAHETERSKFAINARMKNVADEKQFVQVLDEGAFRAHAEHLQPGKLLTFEFRFFNNESHPEWAVQKKHNAHNLSAYYSEFFRIKIGTPGLLIDALDTPNAFPSPRRYAGGWTTIPSVRVEPWSALQQQAFNLTYTNAQAFLSGRTWFHTDFETGKHIGDKSDDKPSRFFDEMVAARAGHTASAYNARSCNACHIHNGDDLLPATGSPVHTTIMKLRDAKTGTPSERWGAQLQTDGDDKEGNVVIDRFERHDVTLDDGTVVTLSKPVFIVKDAADVHLSPRTPPALIGLGLLEAVPVALIEKIGQLNGGTPNKVNGALGRFGWKADQPTVTSQIRTALLNDMGVTSAGHTILDGEATPGVGPLPETAIAELDAYVALLGVPPRNRPEDPGILAGEKIFKDLHCNRCHVHTLVTHDARYPELQHQRIHPYTDLLLHDMGDGLADEGDHPHARLWRTAPLWGLKNTRASSNNHRDKFSPGDTNITYEQTWKSVAENRVQLLHDGRAASLAEAILWHGGAAKDTVTQYKKLPQNERDLLEIFLWDL